MYSTEFSQFAQTILNQKYAHVKKNKTLETWLEISKRAAKYPLQAVNAKKSLIKELEEIIYLRKFIPAGRYLASCGNAFHQVQNCLLLRAEDSRESWAETMNKATMALMTGAGIGVDYSELRAEGKKIRKTGGTSSGPLALMQMVNESGRWIMQGGSRRCLAKGSKVFTYNGLVNIEDIQIGDMVLTFDGFKKVKNVFDQGKQKTIKIKLQTGNEITCTKNHKIAKLFDIDEYEWTKAEDLNIGDILISNNNLLMGEQHQLPENDFIRSENAYTIKNITIPRLDENLAWFLGYFHANGCVILKEEAPGKRHGICSISIPNSAPDIMNKIEEQLSRFGVNVKRKPGCGNCTTIKTHSVILAEYFQKHIKRPNEIIRVPNFVLNNEVSIRSAYLAGVMDGDGCVLGRPINICTSVYGEFIKDLQMLCFSLGITTRIKRSKRNNGKWKDLHKINLVGTKQENRFHDLCSKYSVYKKFDKKFRTKEQFSYSFPRNWVLPNDQYSKISVERYEELTGNKLHYTPVKVVEINEGEVVETYDIEVDERNEFFCEGILVHNSAIWAGLNWKHQDIISFIHAKDWTDEVRKLKEKDYNFPATLDLTNISVQLDDEFFKAFNDEKHILHSHAQLVYWTTIKRMLKTGEPGFSIDVGKNAGETLRNACTEATSKDDSDICNLGSINLARVESLEEMEKIVELSTMYLLAGTVYSDVPYAKVDQIRTKNRRIGVGLMGIHEWLLVHGKKYGPDYELGKYLDIYNQTDIFAKKYAKKWDLNKPVKTRAIAPNGTTGIIAETTTGIEPIFCAAYKRRYKKGLNIDSYQYVLDPTAKRLVENGINPDNIEDAYSIAQDIERRVQFQVFVQQYVDQSISSTINIPAWGSELNNESTVQSFGNMLIKYLPQLRGITVYPDGARSGQPLTPVKYTEAQRREGEIFSEQIDICDWTRGGSCSS